MFIFYKQKLARKQTNKIDCMFLNGSIGKTSTLGEKKKSQKKLAIMNLDQSIYIVSHGMFKIIIAKN